MTRVKAELRWHGSLVKAGTPVKLDGKEVGIVLHDADGRSFDGARVQVELDEELATKLFHNTSIGMPSPSFLIDRAGQRDKLEVRSDYV